MKSILFVDEQLCTKVPSMTELRVSLLSTSGCALKLLDQDFEKYMNTGRDAVDLCLTLFCQNEIQSTSVIIYLDSLLLGVIPFSSVPVIVMVLVVSCLYFGALSTFHKRLLEDKA